MSELLNKTIRMINTTPNFIIFRLSPYDNPANVRVIKLGSNNLNKMIVMPISLALGIFTNPEVYRLYQKGYFTFNDNELLLKAAQEASLYFSDKLDFNPADQNTNDIILTQLQKGNRSAIESAIREYGADRVLDVSRANLDNLTNGVKVMLEQTLKVSFSLNED